MPVAKRRTLFPSDAECSARDHMARLTRRPQPIEALHSTRGDTAYGLATTVTFCEGEPIKATLAQDGRCAMSQSLERRITSDDKPEPRDYVTVPELATLLDVSVQTVTRSMDKAALAMYRPGGEYGHRRIKLATVERYITLCVPDETTRAEMLAAARKLAKQP